MTNRSHGTYIRIHTDGAGPGSRGTGGWCAILCQMNGNASFKTRMLDDGEAATTNNRLELQAAIAALNALRRSRSPLIAVSDSKYLIDGMNNWLPTLKANGWRSAARKPVKNVDLWQMLDRLAAAHVITWRWSVATQEIRQT